MCPRLERRRIPNRGRKNNRIVHCTRQGFFALHHIWFVHDVILERAAHGAPASTSERTDLRATAKWIDGVSFVAETGSGHALVVDGAVEARGPQSGSSTDGAGLGRNGGMHRVRRGVDPEKGAAAGHRLRRGRGSRARARGSQSIYPHPPALSHSRPGSQSGAGRAGGEAFQGKILLRDADAGQDRGKSPSKSRSKTLPSRYRNNRIRLEVSHRAPPCAWIRA